MAIWSQLNHDWNDFNSIMKQNNKLRVFRKIVFCFFEILFLLHIKVFYVFLLFRSEFGIFQDFNLLKYNFRIEQLDYCQLAFFCHLQF